MNRLSGFMPDISPDQLPPDASSYSENMKEELNGWQKSDGLKETFLEPGNEKNYLFFFSPAEGDDRWFIAGSTGIVYYQGKNKLEATRDTGAYSAAGQFNWKGLDFNGIICFNNAVDKLQYFQDKGKFADVTELDVMVRFRNIAKYKAYMFGLGVDSGEGFNDDEIYWSHPADPGTLPASWDFANPAVDAGKTYLPSTGYVVDALELGETFFIYKNDSTWTCRFIGGQFVFSFNEKWSSQGCLAQGCVTEFEGNHFVVTQTDIVVHNGVSSNSVAHRKVKEFFFNDISREFFDRAFVVKRPDTHEIFVFYPSVDSADGSIDKALVWDWVNKDWELRLMPNITQASVGSALPETTSSWDLADTIWDREGSWRLEGDSRVFAPAMYLGMRDRDNIGTISTAGLLFGQPLKAVWERKDITLGRMTRDGVVVQNYENYKTISEITFDVETTENFQVFIGTRDYLNDSVIWEDYGTFEPGQRRTLDLILTTGFLSIRLETEASALRLRNLHIEFEVGGEII
jgi:hypothetical protein